MAAHGGEEEDGGSRGDVPPWRAGGVLKAPSVGNLHKEGRGGGRYRHPSSPTVTHCKSTVGARWGRGGKVGEGKIDFFFFFFLINPPPS